QEAHRQEAHRPRLVQAARLRPGREAGTPGEDRRGSRVQDLPGQDRRQGRFQNLTVIPLQPSAARAQACDRRMRQRLAESLRYIAQAIAGRIEFSPQVLERFLDRLEHAPVSPLAFGAYCDLVLAIDADDLESGSRLLAEILASH